MLDPNTQVKIQHLVVLGEKIDNKIKSLGLNVKDIENMYEKSSPTLIKCLEIISLQLDYRNTLADLLRGIQADLRVIDGSKKCWVNLSKV